VGVSVLGPEAATPAHIDGVAIEDVVSAAALKLDHASAGACGGNAAVDDSDVIDICHGCRWKINACDSALPVEVDSAARDGDKGCWVGVGDDLRGLGGDVNSAVEENRSV